MLGLLIYQGLKTEELRKLETKDIKLKEGKIEVPGGRKSNHRTMTLESHQVLEIYDYTLQARAEILKETREETEKLFITQQESKYHQQPSQELLKAIKSREQNPEECQADQEQVSLPNGSSNTT